MPAFCYIFFKLLFIERREMTSCQVGMIFRTLLPRFLSFRAAVVVDLTHCIQSSHLLSKDGGY